MKSKIIEQDIENIISDFENYLSKLGGKNILITGGNGFIASYLVDTFATFNKKLEKPVNLTIFNKNPITQNSRLSHLLEDSNVKFICQDIGKKFEVFGNPDIIIHAASRSNPTSFLENSLDTIDANVNGIRTLLEYAKDNPVEKFLFFSSAEIYGNPPKEFMPTPESFFGSVDCLATRACYSESKRFAETLCSIFNKKYGVPTEILRIFHTYGPGLRDDGKAITDFFNQAYLDKKIRLRDEGDSRIAFSYVSDTIRGILKVMFNGKAGEAYNIGNDLETVSMKDLADKINRVMGNSSEVEISKQPYRDGYIIIERCPDLKKLREIGFNPLISLKEGLNRLKEDYLERKSH